MTDLFSLEIDHFIRQSIQAALETTEGDVELAAKLKQSPKRFLDEAIRLGIIQKPEEGRLIEIPQPIEKSDEGTTVSRVEEHAAQDEETPPRNARRKVLDRGQPTLDGDNASERPKRPGRPPGRRRSPLGTQPSQLSRAPALPRLRNEGEGVEDEIA